MPTYEYRCDKCRKTFAVVRAMSARPGGSRTPACPKCRSKSTTQVFSTFFAKTVKKS